MDGRQLEYFLAVADELNFTRAAERVFAVQSTVSAGIRSLERELGTTLFERGPRGVALTPTGEGLIPAARAALDALERVAQVADSSAGLRGRLRVGVFTNLSTIDLPGILGEFHRRHPGVDLQLGPSPTGSTGLADDVRTGRLDAALYGLPDAPTGLRVHRLATSRFVAILPEAHLLAARSEVRLRDLVGERFVDAREGFGNRATLDAALVARNLSRRVTTEVSDLGEIPRFVAAGLGVGALPELAVNPAAGAVVRALVEHIDWELRLITRPEPTPAAEALVVLFGERFAEQPR